MQTSRLHFYVALTLGLSSVLAGGCQSGQIPTPTSPATYGRNTTATPDQSNTSIGRSPASNQPLAFIAGQPVTQTAILTRLIQNHGGDALAELALDQMLARRLAEKGVQVSQGLIDAERATLLAELSDDPNQAVQLLKDLQRTRGITQARFRQTLWRNAAMRAIVRDDIQITPLDISQAFDMQYGPLHEARIITTASLGDMQAVISQLKGGTSFIDLAIRHSTDPSREQSGLLPPLSHADPSYPAAIRNALVALEPGQVSPPIAIDNGYAILRLERKIEADTVKLDDVKEALSLSVRRQKEQIQMRQLARTLLAQADVIVLDATLQESWNSQREQMRSSQ